MSFVLQVQIVIKPENVDKFMAKCLENAASARPITAGQWLTVSLVSTFPPNEGWARSHGP